MSLLSCRPCSLLPRLDGRVGTKDAPRRSEVRYCSFDEGRFAVAAAVAAAAAAAADVPCDHLFITIMFYIYIIMMMIMIMI